MCQRERDHISTAASEIRRKQRSQQLINDFLTQLDRYYSSPHSSYYDTAIEKRFYEQKLRYLNNRFTWENDGLVTFGASGTDKCDVEIFFRNQDVKPQKSPDLPFRGRQRRMGTAVVDYVQLDLVAMPGVLEKDGHEPSFVVAESNGDWLFEDAAAKREVFEYDGVKFAIVAFPDGLLRYVPDGADEPNIIFEYKTKATGLLEMQSKLTRLGPDEHHIRQIVAESLVYGIREGIILYESTQKPSWFSDEESKNVAKTRRTWADGEPVSDLYAAYVYVTDAMQERLLADLARQARLVYEGKKPDVTVDCVQKCGFCPYYEHCRSTITPENLEELKAIEEKYAKSRLAGVRTHQLLREYLLGGG